MIFTEPEKAPALQTAATRLNELRVKDELSWEVRRLDGPLAARLLDLMKKSYEQVGIPSREERDFLSYDWALLMSQGAGMEVKSAVLFRESRSGLKLSLIMSDGSRDGKWGSATFLRQISDFDGMYAGVSLAPAQIAFRSERRKIVPYAIVERIFSEFGVTVDRPSPEELAKAMAQKVLPDDPDVRENAYAREVDIAGRRTRIIKVMFGNPSHAGEPSGR